MSAKLDQLIRLTKLSAAKSQKFLRLLGVSKNPQDKAKNAARLKHHNTRLNNLRNARPRYESKVKPKPVLTKTRESSPAQKRAAAKRRAQNKRNK